VSKHKLLLADDSITIQKVVNLTFADEGVDVIAVGDGDSAMDKLRENLPDLVLADVNMPGLNGYEICEKIKQSKNASSIPVVLLVGSFEPFDEDEAKRVGADAYLTKPFQSISQLIEKVKSLLNRQDDEDLKDTAELPIQEEAAVTEPLIETSSVEDSDNFDELIDNFGEEVIQTNQVGSLPIDETAKYSSASEIPEIDLDDRSFDEEFAEFTVENNDSNFKEDDLTEEEMANAFDESPEANGEKDFHQTQPLTNDDYKELAVDENISEKESVAEDTDFEITDIGMPLALETDVSEELLTPTDVLHEEAETETEDIYSDFNALERENTELPEPEAANVLELDLDDINLLDLPPMESDDDELIVEERFTTESPDREEVAIEDVESGELQIEEFVSESYNASDANELPEEPEPTSDYDIGISKAAFMKDYGYEELSETDKAIDKAVSPEMVEVITKKVVERLSERAVREIAWEVVPQLADLIIKKMAEEKMKE